jgi:hypothetical protein
MHNVFRCDRVLSQMATECNASYTNTPPWPVRLRDRPQRSIAEWLSPRVSPIPWLIGDRVPGASACARTARLKQPAADLDLPLLPALSAGGLPPCGGAWPGNGCPVPAWRGVSSVHLQGWLYPTPYTDAPRQTARGLGPRVVQRPSAALCQFQRGGRFLWLPRNRRTR